MEGKHGKITNNTVSCDCGGSIENDDIVDSEGSIPDEFIEETCYGHCTKCGKRYNYQLKLTFQLKQATVVSSEELGDDERDDEVDDG